MEKLKDFFTKLKGNITWEKITLYFSGVIIPFVKQNLSKFLLRAFKISGGVYSWVLSAIILKAVEKALQRLHSAAKKEDKKNVDEKAVVDYEQNLKEGKTVEDAIKSGSDFLNSDKP